jgi:hypothetical protein
MLLSYHLNAGQNHDIKIDDRCFENVAQFRCLGTTVTNQNLIQEEIKRRCRQKVVDTLNRIMYDEYMDMLERNGSE